MDEERERAHRETHAVWEANAAYWDERMGEGNDFFELLVWPATERLLELQPGERVLDVACGNGLAARRLARLGANVVAFDFSAALIARARARTAAELADRITYHVLDATDEGALLTLGERAFDAAVCNMALFDIAEIDPLLRALTRLLHPGGRFVFSVLHPCFNNPYMVKTADEEDRDGQIVLRYAVKVYGYLTAGMRRALAMRGQPQVQWVFHRPLQELFGSAFQAGLVCDGLIESAFPPDVQAGGSPLGWSGKFSEIPPVLVARLRLPMERG